MNRSIAANLHFCNLGFNKTVGHSIFVFWQLNNLSLSLFLFLFFLFIKNQMAVFSQIKNFIKNSYIGGQKYETAARIVEEENKAKNTMPNYPELDSYRLTAKLGE